ncbi:MAG TPA: hypothetical protein VGK49_09830, partial [Ilumatobacteraceae bacterium]
MHRKHRTRAVIALALVAAAGLATASPARSAPSTPESAATPILDPSADEQSSVVEVVLSGSAELDRLVATGVDLDHQVHRYADGVVVHAVVTPSEVAALEAQGFTLGQVVSDPDQTAARIAERDATIAEHVAENEAFAAAAYDEATPIDVSDVRIIRADYYTSFGQSFLSVEAKWASGQTSGTQLVVERDSGPGTAFGSGGSQNIARFVDAGVYLYHRGAASVTSRPDRIRIVSPTGDIAIAKVNDWLPLPGESEVNPSYLTGFITSYLTPTELYDRIHALAAEFPDIAEVVELPYKTNGYRRKAQALLDPPPSR